MFRFKRDKTIEKAPGDKRGEEQDLLYGISNIVTKVRDNYNYIAFAGTALSLSNANIIQSVTSHNEDLDIVMNLSYFMPKDLQKEFRQFVHIPEGCIISEKHAKLLTGRSKLLCLTVQYLCKMNGTL